MLFRSSMRSSEKSVVVGVLGHLAPKSRRFYDLHLQREMAMKHEYMIAQQRAAFRLRSIG